MKKIFLILIIGLSINTNGQTIYKVTPKHNLEMDSILQTATYDPWNQQIIVNYGIWRSIVPCESGWLLFDYNDQKYFIKQGSPYYTRIQDSLKPFRERSVINEGIKFH